MEEKRLSIRFRMDNPQDRKAWDLLQILSSEENLSKNAIALRLICKGADACDTPGNSALDLIANQIADLVADKLLANAGSINFIPASNSEAAEKEAKAVSEPDDDEIRTVSKEALSFLDDF